MRPVPLLPVQTQRRSSEDRLLPCEGPGLACVPDGRDLSGRLAWECGRARVPAALDQRGGLQLRSVRLVEDRPANPAVSWSRDSSLSTPLSSTPPPSAASVANAQKPAPGVNAKGLKGTLGVMFRSRWSDGPGSPGCEYAVMRTWGLCSHGWVETPSGVLVSGYPCADLRAPHATVTLSPKALGGTTGDPLIPAEGAPLCA